MKACGDGISSDETGPPSRVSHAQTAMKNKDAPMLIATAAMGDGSLRQTDVVRLRRAAGARVAKASASAVTDGS